MRISRAQLYSLLQTFNDLPGCGEGVFCCPGVVEEKRKDCPFLATFTCAIGSGGSTGAEGRGCWLKGHFPVLGVVHFSAPPFCCLVKPLTKEKPQTGSLQTKVLANFPSLLVVK